MITLNPEFVGSMAPPTNLTTGIDGKSGTPFARLPRQRRLKLQGRADETEEVSEGEEGDEGEEGVTSRKEEKEKKRMRGKNKAMKRYLRKQRKNVIDPKAVCFGLVFNPFVLYAYRSPCRWHSERSCRKRGNNGRKPEMRYRAYEKMGYQALLTVSGLRSTRNTDVNEVVGVKLYSCTGIAATIKTAWARLSLPSSRIPQPTSKPPSCSCYPATVAHFEPAECVKSGRRRDRAVSVGKEER